MVPSVSATSWLHAEASSRTSRPIASTSAVTASRSDLATLPAELGGDEITLIAIGLDRRAVDHAGIGGLHRVEHLFPSLVRSLCSTIEA
jgi:hypothetical protein